MILVACSPSDGPSTGSPSTPPSTSSGPATIPSTTPSDPEPPPTEATPAACLEALTAAEDVNDVTTTYIGISTQYEKLIRAAYEAGRRDVAVALETGDVGPGVDEIAARRSTLENRIAAAAADVDGIASEFTAASAGCQDDGPPACVAAVGTASELHDFAATYVELSIGYQDLVTPAYEAGFRDAADAVATGTEGTRIDDIAARRSRVDRKIAAASTDLDALARTSRASRDACLHPPVNQDQSSPTCVTTEMFDRVEIGATRAKVATILGSDGEPADSGAGGPTFSYPDCRGAGHGTYVTFSDFGQNQFVVIEKLRR